jgi:hypothetical protein
MKFVAQLDEVNALAEGSPVCMAIKDEGNNATGFNPYNDNRLIVNMSYGDVKHLQNMFIRQTRRGAAEAATGSRISKPFTTMVCSCR